MAILDIIDDLPDISFIDGISLETVQTQLINNYLSGYEKINGASTTLGKADAKRLILNACALLIYQGYQYIERAGKQDLIKYAYGEYLDNLAALKGLTRNKATAATVTVRFTLSELLSSAIAIPQGTRVTVGYKVYFQTTEYNEIPAGEQSIDIVMECIESGEIGNGYMPGEIDTLVDQIAYIDTVTNINTSDGGSEREDDVSLAERTYLAPSSYSTAGPDEAYVYWVKTFNTAISDVKVTSPSPVHVDIRFIKTDGELPDQSMIDSLQDYLQDRNVRPLTDEVTVSAPDIVSYDLDIKYFINSSDSSRAVTIQTDVIHAIDEYITWQRSVIGRDINPSELTKLVVAAGAKRVEINKPLYTVIPDTSVAKLSSQQVAYGGVEDD